ncbi:PhoD domain-containing protein [Balamuthia mandrillaris]
MKEEGSNRGSSAFSPSLRYPTTLPKNATVWYAVVVTLISGLTMLGVAGQAEKELLLVVGDVSDHTARVLYEGYHALGQKGEETMIASLIDETTASLIVDTVIQVRTFPAVLKLADLLPEHNYSVSFYSFSSGRENADLFRGQVFFRTFPSHSTAPALFKVAALSCNRWYDDRDVELWEKLALLDNDSDVMLHLGDNIYADRIWKDFISYLSQVPETSAEWEKRRAEATYEYFLPKYRHIYRETFGQETVQKVLRRNAHWIITDDHEFVNNFGPDLLKDPVLAPMVWAGRTAFLEYQMQLLMDIEPAVMYFHGSLVF